MASSQNVIVSDVSTYRNGKTNGRTDCTSGPENSLSRLQARVHLLYWDFFFEPSIWCILTTLMRLKRLTKMMIKTVNYGLHLVEGVAYLVGELADFVFEFVFVSAFGLVFASGGYCCGHAFLGS